MIRSWLAAALVPPALLAAQAPSGASRADRPLPVSLAVRTVESPRIDGRLDDGTWAAAPVTNAFTQIDPNEGEPATQRTEVRVLYDDEAMYLGVRLWDTGAITARLGRRDMPYGDSDWFGVRLDSYHDFRTAFGFEVNPAGVRRDAVKTISTDDNSWDAVWTVSTSVDSVGWNAEFRIPFSQLRFSRDEVQTWGIQFERTIGRTREFAVSTFIPKRESGGVPWYGYLQGLRDVVPGKRLEVLPYSVARAEFVDPRANPYRTDRAALASAGLDVRYRVASNLTLNATFNPDFGQVEVDPAVVNLGVYETFFDEKRPFFLEGTEIFDFGSGGGTRMFYSRRIGRQPTLAPPSQTADVPPTTTILGAGKISGKVAGWSIGTLTALTARENSRYRDAANMDRRYPAEPASAYFVGRARREVRGGRTIIGGLLTAVRRQLDTDELRANFRSSALAGGADFRHEWANRTWAIRGDVAGSLIAGSAASITAVQRASNHYFQRPDATHLGVDSTATSLGGYAMSTALTKQGGEHWRGEVSGARTSAAYEVNDLGFLNRTDRQDLQGRLMYLQNRPGAFLRQWNLTATVRSEHNFVWMPIMTTMTTVFTTTTLSYWTASANVKRRFESYDDRTARGGPNVIRPAALDVTLALSTDPRRALTGDVNAFVESVADGGWTSTTSVALGVKASSRWNLSIGPTLMRLFVPGQYVTSVVDRSYVPTFGRRYLFAPLTQTQLGLEGRLNVTFTPSLSFETYVQPLLSAADYAGALQLVAPNTLDFAPYAGTIPNLDFNLRSLRGNAVLRWEFRAGSTLFVVWQQQRRDQTGESDFALGRDQEALFATRPDNIFLVKINYWMNP